MTKKEYNSIKKVLAKCKRERSDYYYINNLERLKTWRTIYIQSKTYTKEQLEYFGGPEKQRETYKYEKYYCLYGPLGKLPG